ncbi:hypothetical protein BJ322DRAFT_364622 [Thelephora terrestris]|uniref:Transcription elongation factor Eaf N-terminal domain-containing protein n=1 Tax=Thelephora terrestris TaxID=56493 RepID=A0A9P6H4W8_9AGAM|nr:hypothetical protein BJ322DRAFT_364622 [Thelephora terrestris]
MSHKNDTSWMPPNGTHPVTVGSSLAGALKANRGLPEAPKLSNRGFYSFRYNFKPESIDLYKPGTIEIKKDGDRKTATIERASTVPGEGQLFTGTEAAANDVDCVLMYDEDTGTFTLEKLDSLINVAWGGKSTMPSNRPSESPPVVAPSAPDPPTKKAYDDELEHELLSAIEGAPPKRPTIKQEPPPPKPSTSSTPSGASGLQSLPKKPVVRPKPKPKGPAPIFMNPKSDAAKVASKKSAPAKREPKPDQKLPVSSQPTTVSKLATLVGDLKGKGVKREVEPGSEEPARVQKRPKPSPPPSKTQLQPRPRVNKPPPLAAGLPPKPQTTTVPLQPPPKPQPPAKKGFSLELPTGTSSGSSSKNPLLASGSGGTSYSLPTAPSVLVGTQPSTSAVVDTTPVVLSDSESDVDWDEVEADVPPLNQTQSQPPPYTFGGSLTIEEDPPAGFSGTLDIVEGDDDRYEDADADADAEGEAEGEDIDLDDLVAEMDQQLQGGDGEQEGEGEGNEMEDFLINAVSEQGQEACQDVDFLEDAMFGDDDSSSSSDDSD